MAIIDLLAGVATATVICQSTGDAPSFHCGTKSSAWKESEPTHQDVSHIGGIENRRRRGGVEIEVTYQDVPKP